MNISSLQRFYHPECLLAFFCPESLFRNIESRYSPKACLQCAADGYLRKPLPWAGNPLASLLLPLHQKANAVKPDS